MWCPISAPSCQPRWLRRRRHSLQRWKKIIALAFWTDNNNASPLWGNICQHKLLQSQNVKSWGISVFQGETEIFLQHQQFVSICKERKQLSFLFRFSRTACPSRPAKVQPFPSSVPIWRIQSQSPTCVTTNITSSPNLRKQDPLQSLPLFAQRSPPGLRQSLFQTCSNNVRLDHTT